MPTSEKLSQDCLSRLGASPGSLQIRLNAQSCLINMSGKAPAAGSLRNLPAASALPLSLLFPQPFRAIAPVPFLNTKR